MKVSEPIVTCYHCGDSCESGVLHHASHDFCCQGCVAVYDLLQNSGLTEYYSNEQNPGVKAKEKHNFAYLDDPKVENKLLSYADDKRALIKIHLPAIHCSSCVWLLENISRLDGRIINSTVNYLKKEAAISFNRSMKLSELATLLDKIGYVPDFNLNDLSKKKKTRIIP